MRHKKLKILLWGSNIWYLSVGMLGPLFAVFAQKVGGSVLDITWAWASYLIVSGIGIMVIGRISDYFPRGKEIFLVCGYAINTVFTFAYLFVSNPFELLLVQVGFGLGNTFSTGPWGALYDEHTDGKNDGFIWGAASGQSAISTGVAMILGGLIVTYYSFDLLFATMGILQVCTLVYTARLLKYRN